MNENPVMSTASGMLSHVRATDLFRHIDDETLREIAAALERVSLKSGDTLFLEGEEADAMYIVISGRLRVFTHRKNEDDVLLGEIGENSTVGEMQILAGGKRTAGVSAVTDTELARLSKISFEEVVTKAPEIVDDMVQLTRRRLRRNEIALMLTSMFGHMNENILAFIEAQMEWIQLKPGDLLCRQGDPGDSLYLVVSGRLKAVRTDSTGKERTIGKITRGESVGEMAVFSESPRTATVYATRESQLARLSKEALERIMHHNPQVMMTITKIIINRLRRTISSSVPETTELNIALVPASPDVPLAEFALRLNKAMSKYGETLYLNSRRLDNDLGKNGISQTPQDNPYNIRLSIWLDEQDARHRYVTYEADKSPSNWTQRCFQRADKIIIVAQASDTPTLGESGALIRKRKQDDATFHQTLVLLHPNGDRLPSGTKRWLDLGDFEEHHHIRWDRDEDFERLARFITGNAVGLVLGGGGARGFAHVGVLQAFRETGMPIDMVGGTSMGSIVAAFPSMQWDQKTSLEKCRKSFVDINPLSDYTLPVISLMRSKVLDAQLQATFGDIQIEDLWINYFNVSSNLSTAEVVVARRGPLWRAIRASVSLPGIAVPVLHGRHLLVDGGVLNNVPVDIMRRLCNGYVFAIDVSKETSINIDYDEIPSPWKIFFSRFFLKKMPPVPSMLQILGQTTLLGSINRTHTNIKEADLYLQPPVERFKLMEWKSLTDIAETGYLYVKPELESWLHGKPELKGRLIPDEAWPEQQRGENTPGTVP